MNQERGMGMVMRTRVFPGDCRYVYMYTAVLTRGNHSKSRDGSGYIPPAYEHIETELLYDLHWIDEASASFKTDRHLNS